MMNHIDDFDETMYYDVLVDFPSHYDVMNGRVVKQQPLEPMIDKHDLVEDTTREDTRDVVDHALIGEPMIDRHYLELIMMTIAHTKGIDFTQISDLGYGHGDLVVEYTVLVHSTSDQNYDYLIHDITLSIIRSAMTQSNYIDPPPSFDELSDNERSMSHLTLRLMTQVERFRPSLVSLA